MISNTKILDRDDLDAMNEGIRGRSLRPRDASKIADFFGVTAGQVRRWFVTSGTYRRLLVLPPNKRTPEGKRVFKMFDADDETGVGDGNENRGAGPYQNMRLRCLFGAALGAGGLYRPNPVFSGKRREEAIKKAYLDEALFHLNDVYTGDAAYGEFLRRAWVELRLEPRFEGDSQQVGWYAVVVYHEALQGEQSDEEEVPDDEGDPNTDPPYDDLGEEIE